MQHVTGRDEAMSPSPARDQASSILELLADCRPTLVEQPITDFSGTKSIAAKFCRIAPRTVEDVCRVGFVRA